MSDNDKVAEPVFEAPNAGQMRVFNDRLETGDAEPEVVETEVEVSAEDKAAEKIAEEVVKEEESQDSEDSTPSEEEVADEKKSEDDDENSEDRISDDDINEIFQEKKSGVQKRIDKLTAEKKATAEQNAELLRRIEELENSRKEKEVSKDTESRPHEYTWEQLKKAKAKALRDEDDNLFVEVELAEDKLREWESNQKKLSVTKAESEYTRQEKLVLQQIKDDYKDVTDPDLMVTDKNSKIYQLAVRLTTDDATKSKYAAYGPYAAQKAVDDAHKLILEVRNKKKLKNATKSLENKIAKERRKNSLSSGGPGNDKSISERKKEEYDMDPKSIIKKMQKSVSKLQGG